jgi:aldose 1-epimerase
LRETTARQAPGSGNHKQAMARPILASGSLRVALAPEQGGRVAAFWREDESGPVSILVPMDDSCFAPHLWPKAGCYPLAPFSNRIRDGRFAFDGREVRLPAHPACPPHALHGFSQLRPWEVGRVDASSATMTYAHAPDEWPWAFTASQAVSLTPTALTIEIAIRNDDPALAMPVGLGLHPYLAVSHGDRIRFSADAEWTQDDAGCGVALAPSPPGEVPYDRPHGPEGCTRYLAGWDRRAEIHRRDGARILITAAGALDQLVFHVPDGGAYACIEPVSHVADAFNLAARGVAGAGMRVARPGETISGSVTITLA